MVPSWCVTCVDWLGLGFAPLSIMDHRPLSLTQVQRHRQIMCQSRRLSYNHCHSHVNPVHRAQMRRILLESAKSGAKVSMEKVSLMSHTLLPFIYFFARCFYVMGQNVVI